MIPEISVMIAAYNAASTIERAIQSVFEQEGVFVEIIVVDDASQDDTCKRVRTLQDPRITLIPLTENGGPAAARNAGFEAAKAPYIAVLDGDDAFLPGRLARLLYLAKEKKAQIVVDNLRVLRVEDGALFPMFAPTLLARLNELNLPLFIKGKLAESEKYTLGYLKPLFETSFLRTHNLRYDPSLRIGEDYVLMAEALASGALCAIEPSEGYLYTVQAGSISHRLTSKAVAAMMEGDRAWTTRRKLDGKSLKAQEKREAELRHLWAYNRLVEAIKEKDMPMIARLALQDPRSLLGLWEPVAVRLKRLF